MDTPGTPTTRSYPAPGLWARRQQCLQTWDCSAPTTLPSGSDKFKRSVSNPCSGHSLNLVGVHVVGSCSEASNFFAIVQSVYNFFSASTHRWAILKRCAQEKSLTLKSFSTTRWSARADAVSVLNQCLSQIIKALKEIEENISENPIARQEAKGIRNQLESLEFTFMLSLWDFLLSRFNAVNLRLQNVKISIDEVVNQYEALIKIVDETRDQFDYYEIRALNMSEIKEYRSETQRPGKRKLKADETRDGELELSARDKFRVDAFNVILDELLSELNSRCASYTEINEKFAGGSFSNRVTSESGPTPKGPETESWVASGWNDGDCEVRLNGG
ncbi:uncharacterized protein LOC117169823 [Belonocnema kinseyi]|uniref:uncharacterized protein LOC117169823 n=1 Tax=Belonocnema kinseyi TaxID=2817044 RepID=UPI00143D32FC|nr:uncharacterized protein LOC117169823 [Belonocnema kinseyi]